MADADDFEDLLNLTQDDEPEVAVSEDETDFGGMFDEDDVDPTESAIAQPWDDEPTPAPAPPVAAAPRKPRVTKKALVVVDPLDDEIAKLQAALSQPMPSFAEPEEDPEVLAKKQMIKELQDQLAQRNTTIVENAPARLVRAEGPGEKILIHFENDGLIALGQSWYRGQELEFVVGGEAYQATQDRNGDSWLDLVNSRSAQEARWGKVMFAPGPFVPRPGEVFQDDLVREDARRGRAVPLAQG